MKIAVLYDVEVPGLTDLHPDEREEVKMDVLRAVEDRDAEHAFEELVEWSSGVKVKASIVDFREVRPHIIGLKGLPGAL